MNSLFDVISLKVNSDYLWAKGPGKRKSCRVGINCVNFRCTLEESPFNTADLYDREVPGPRYRRYRLFGHRYQQRRDRK